MGQNVTYLIQWLNKAKKRLVMAETVSWYQDQFNTGAMDRAAALIGFAESPENVALVAPDLLNGVWLPDPV